MAEDNGLISPIGEWVHKDACQQAKNGLIIDRVAVNILSVRAKKGQLPTIVRHRL